MSATRIDDLSEAPAGYHQLDDVPGLPPLIRQKEMERMIPHDLSHYLERGMVLPLTEDEHRLREHLGQSIEAVYQCAFCSAVCPEWSRNCTSCGRHGTITETVNTSEHQLKACQPVAYFRTKEISRVSTGIPAWDTMLSGGFARGGTTIVGGEPYAGKSTILMACAHRVNVKRSLYVTAEEGLNSVALRARRLGIDEAERNAGYAKTHIAQIEDTDRLKWMIYNRAPDLVVVDSINKLSSLKSTGQAGSISQIMTALDILRRFAQHKQIVMLIVGQVRKDKQIAGPQKFIHEVDTVIRVSKDRKDPLVRRAIATKDRFNDYASGKYPPIDTWVAWRMSEDGREFSDMNEMDDDNNASSLIDRLAGLEENPT